MSTNAQQTLIELIIHLLGVVYGEIQWLNIKRLSLDANFETTD
jgi:hypothetical protein